VAEPLDILCVIFILPLPFGKGGKWMEKEATIRAGKQKDYDILEKELEEYPDVFADIVNAFVYKGEKVVNEMNLIPVPQETRYRDAAGKLKRQTEDIGKYEKADGKARALFLLANQSTIDSRMILRKCGYTGGYYRGQYNGQVKDICPVLELVLYWGRKRWNSAGSISEFFRRKKLPDVTWDFIDDEKLHVFEMRHLPQEIVGRFTSDMRIVLECLSVNPDKSYLKREIKHKEAFQEILNVLLEEEEYMQLFRELEAAGLLEGSKGGGKTVIDIIGITKEEGKKEGLQQGIRALVTTCKEFGATFEETANKLKEKFSLTDAEIQRGMKLYW